MNIRGCLLFLAVFFGISGVAQATLVNAFTEGAATTDWVYDVPGGAPDSVSLQTFWPRPGNNIAGAEFTNFTEPRVGSIDGWDFWAKTDGAYRHNFVLYLSDVLDVVSGEYLTNYSGESFSSIVYVETNDPGGSTDWNQALSTTLFNYRMHFNDDFGFPVNEVVDWNGFQTQTFDWFGAVELDYSNAKVEKARVSNDGIGTNDTITANLDNVTIGTENFALVPEPSVIILAATGIGLLSMFYRRKKRCQKA